jgi:hypothetical protein
VFWVFAVTAAPGRAELPPQVYREMQEAAPEVIRIRVRGVRTEYLHEREGTLIRVTVRAVVLDIERSQSGLRSGQCVVIVYSRFDPKVPVAGPSEPPLLRVGRESPAYLALDRDLGVYRLAARGASFAKVSE